MKTEDELFREIKAWQSIHGIPPQDDSIGEYPEGLSEYDRARHYVLYFGSMYGLPFECLSWFYRFEKETPGDPWRNANDALSEWDI